MANKMEKAQCTNALMQRRRSHVAVSVLVFCLYNVQTITSSATTIMERQPKILPIVIEASSTTTTSSPPTTTLQTYPTTQNRDERPMENVTASDAHTTNKQHQQYHTAREQAIRQQPHCVLGDDTFQIGERWNPNLPPFGIQVCVLCECTIRSRKSCYETKVTCRRMINECPIIDSCPDGKKPVTQPGQCCKSCQIQASSPPAYEATQTMQQQPLPQETSNQPTTSFKIVYMNERTKDYLSMVKDLPACSNSGETFASQGGATSGATVAAQTSATTQSSVVGAAPMIAVAGAPATAASKNAKGTRNDLNGIDTRLAFKSLHDSAPLFINSLSSRNTDNGKSVDQQAKRRTGGSSRQTIATETDQQHPNDVQSATQRSTSTGNKQYNQYNTNLASSQQQTQQPSLATPYSCLLGNETFQVGDVWRPLLPPHGVQVCVQCNCIFRVRKGCFETKVTCRRTHRDCPVIESCPDGQLPIVTEGQCCKSCPPSFAQETSNVMIEQQRMLNSLPPPETIQRNEKVYRDFQNISKNLNACVKNRDSIDIYQTHRYTRRSHNNYHEKV